MSGLLSRLSAFTASRLYLARAGFPRRRFTSERSLLHEPTIYALSSAPGRAAIAVIRISGPACLDIYRALCPRKAEPKPRVATVRTLFEVRKEPSRDTVLDSSALILYFPSPATATGEDILELHVHGGSAIVQAVLAAIPRCRAGALDPIRYAEPGEFTRRAFLNDRLDLTQVEALGDALAADTEQQRRLSVRGTTGSLAARYDDWRQQLLYARGELEALIDFSEDQHFDESPAELCASVAAQVETLVRALQVHDQNAMRGEMLRHGISISFLGAPNAGKSSLLNRIVGREAAIVSAEAGTTRDVVEVGLDIGGYFCRLGDTAGLRQARQDAQSSGLGKDVISQIEQEGMRRAKNRAVESDLVVVVLSFEQMDGHVALLLDPEVCSTASHLAREKGNVMVVINKADLAVSAKEQDAARRAVLETFTCLSDQHIHMVSCIEIDTPAIQGSDPGGIQSFLRSLIGQFAELTTAMVPDGGAGAESDPSIWKEALGASARHRLLLEACISHLAAFLAEVLPSTSQSTPEDATGEADIVLAAEHLRSAADCLAKITGKGIAGDVEEVLGVVFEKFCVGK